MNKVFYKSKEFWMFAGAILASTASIFTGEMTLVSVLPKLLVDVLGILGIIFRWNNPASPLGWSK